MSQVMGVLLIILAIAAGLSGEPAARTNSGAIALTFATVLGVIMVAQGARKSKEKHSVNAQPQAAPAPSASIAVPKVAKCPRCGQEITSDYVACPHCGVSLRIKCPSCGRWLNPEFMVCPYCGTNLKEEHKTNN
jgi:membrane protease subunit (stomatin/prohibitin family)